MSHVITWKFSCWLPNFSDRHPRRFLKNKSSERKKHLKPWRKVCGKEKNREWQVVVVLKKNQRQRWWVFSVYNHCILPKRRWRRWKTTLAIFSVRIGMENMVQYVEILRQITIMWLREGCAGKWTWRIKHRPIRLCQPKWARRRRWDLIRDSSSMTSPRCVVRHIKPTFSAISNFQYTIEPPMPHPQPPVGPWGHFIRRSRHSKKCRHFGYHLIPPSPEMPAVLLPLLH